MKLQIGSRMRVGFLAMTLLLLVGGLVTVLYTYRLQRVTTALLDENVSSLQAAQELEVALFRMRGLTANYLLDGDPQWLDTLEERKGEFREWLARARTTAVSAKEQAILNEIARRFAEYERNLIVVIAHQRVGEAERAREQLALAVRDVFEDIYQLCERFVFVNEQMMYSGVDKIERANSAVRAAMYGLAVGGVLLGYVLGLVITRSIERPIYELVLKVRGAAGGEFVERMDVAQRSGLDALDNHVAELIRRINTTRADLERNRRLLVRAEQLAALGKVSAGVAHEIRNPLTAIKMLTYSLQEDASLTLDRRRDLDVMGKEIARMERFVDAFLQFARPPDPRRVPTRLDEVVRETLAILAPRLQQGGARVVESHDPQLGTVAADPDQIKQVVMNLVINALEAMPEGGELWLETARLRGTGAPDWIRLQVRDAGPGIPESILDNIFDPFVSGREEGTGLGLSISSQIVRLHGGWIDACNQPEGGATFTVCLPEDPEARAREPQVMPAGERSGGHA